MIRHLFKAIAFEEIDGGVLRIDHKADTANLFRDARYPVNGVEKQMLSYAFMLMLLGCCQPPNPKYGNLDWQPFSVLRREVGVNQFSQANRVKAKHFCACPGGCHHKG
jgi:hypothetical protein